MERRTSSGCSASIRGRRIDAFYIAGADHYRRTTARGDPDTIQKLESIVEKQKKTTRGLHTISAVFLDREGIAEEQGKVATFLKVHVLPRCPSFFFFNLRTASSLQRGVLRGPRVAALFLSSGNSGGRILCGQRRMSGGQRKPGVNRPRDPHVCVGQWRRIPGRGGAASGHRRDAMKSPVMKPTSGLLPADVEGFDFALPACPLICAYSSWNHSTDDVWRQLDPVQWEAYAQSVGHPADGLPAAARGACSPIRSFGDKVDALVKSGDRAEMAPAWFSAEISEV